MSAKSITLRNFRGFQEATIDLKPLTVLLGPNSAGKSSFGHALSAMSHAHRIFGGTPQATLTPSADHARSWPVDLGDLKDLRRHGTEGPVEVEFNTDAGSIKFGFGGDNLTGLMPSYFSFPKGEEHPEQRFEGTHVAASYQQNSVSPAAQTGSVDSKFIAASHPQERYEIRRLNSNQWQEGGRQSVVVLDGLLLKALTHQAGTSRVLSGAAQNEIQSLLVNLAYLRATRERPSRTYKNELGKPQPIGYSGEHAATILYERGREAVRYADLPAIPNTVEEAKSLFSTKSTVVEESLTSAIQRWLVQLGLAASVESQLSSIDEKGLEILVGLPNQVVHNIIEIGFGISQVLPVLTCGLLQSPGSLFIVDLPEAHLHPRPQAALADFFCSLALAGRFNLVETHSEMFFHRLRLRAEADHELRENIAVYFIDQPEDGVCKEPRLVGLKFDDQVKWPIGFLQEAWELESQIEAVRQARAELKV